MADTADTIVDAFLSLLAERPYADVTVRAIADEAGVSLAVLNQHFATRVAIVEAFSRRVDQAVLAADLSDMADQAPRDRLFDVLMSRLDALAPHRAALKSLMRSARRDPQLGLALNRIALRSQAWMLAAAGLSVSGLRGRLAVQSLIVAFAKVLRVFLAEEDPGMPRTMAALDQELKALEERHNRLARFFGSALSPERAAAAAEPAWAAEPATNGAAVAPEAAAEPVDAGKQDGPKRRTTRAASSRPAASASGKAPRGKPRTQKRPRRAGRASKDEPETP